MAVKSWNGSGPALSMSEIAAEFEDTTQPYSLSEYYAGGTYVPASTTGDGGVGAIPTSGSIRMRHFYGASNVAFASGVKYFDDGVVLNGGAMTSTGSGASSREAGWKKGYTVTITGNGRLYGRAQAVPSGAGSGSDNGVRIQKNGSNVASAGAPAWNTSTCGGTFDVVAGDIITFWVSSTCWRCFGATVNLRNAELTGA